MSWTEVELGTWAPLTYGKALPEPSREPGNVPVYSSAGLTGSHSTALVESPAVVVGRKGNVGTVFYVDSPFFPIDTAFYTHGSLDADLRFVAYKLQSLRLGQHTRDSAVPGLRRDDYSALRTLVPSLREQGAIAEVLGALDDKIVATATLVASSDALRAAKFRALEAERSLPLSSVARFVNGRAFTKGATGTGRVVVRIAELNSGLGGSTVRTDLEVAPDHVARPGSILFAWSGSLMVKRWFRHDAIVNQHIFNVLPHDEIPAWLAFELVESKIKEFRLIAADKATTMGHIQRRHLDEPVRLPSAEVIGQIDAEMDGLWRLALNLEQESERLSALRDALLPELMSGRLGVKDAERAVEEAV